jgi:hypothetical protein
MNKYSPEEEGKPADHKGSHYDAQGAGRLVLCTPARTLLSYRGACNRQTLQPHICIFINVTRTSTLTPPTFCTTRNVSCDLRVSSRGTPSKYTEDGFEFCSCVCAFGFLVVIRDHSYILMKEATDSSETLALIQQSARHHIPQSIIFIWGHAVA